METVKNQRNVVKENLKHLSIYIAAVVKEILEKLPVDSELFLYEKGFKPSEDMYISLSPKGIFKEAVRGGSRKTYVTPDDYFSSSIKSIARADEVISKIEEILSKHNIKIKGKYLPKYREKIGIGDDSWD